GERAILVQSCLYIKDLRGGKWRVSGRTHEGCRSVCRNQQGLLIAQHRFQKPVRRDFGCRIKPGIPVGARNDRDDMIELTRRRDLRIELDTSANESRPGFYTGRLK